MFDSIGIWFDNSTKAKSVLSNEELWGTDLTKLKDFTENVTTHLSNMMVIGVREVVSALNVYA